MEVKSFVTITDDQIDKLGIETTKSYYYLNNGNKVFIEEKPLEDSTKKEFEIIDEDGDLELGQQSIFLNLNVVLKNPSILFGYSGIAFDDAVLGFGVTWSPVRSRIKYCKKLGEIIKTSNPITFTSNDIELKELNSNTEFEFIIYIKEPGHDIVTNGFGKEKGLVLGSGLLWKIVFDGEASQFPIYFMEKTNGPLWEVTCNLSDPYTDMFNNVVAIYLNPLHPAFQFIDEKNPDFYNPYFYRETIESAMSTILVEIKAFYEEGHSFDFDCEEVESGTVHQAVRYFMSVDINFKGSYVELISSIKKYCEEVIKI